jgi:hypothetical protein
VEFSCGTDPTSDKRIATFLARIREKYPEFLMEW